MSDYPMLISNKLHSFRNFSVQRYQGLIMGASLDRYRGGYEPNGMGQCRENA